MVAAEVRSLTQRSAEAAKEIKGLMDNSVQQVESGSSLVGTAGQPMQEIVQAVADVTEILGDISLASSQQSSGIEHINESVARMDTVTQQNAALVEQAAGGSAELAEQALQLQRTVGAFKL